MARRHTGAAHKMLVRCVATAALVAGWVVSATAVAVPTAAASAVCGSETVAYAYEGACASYGTYAGWYGSYGPGFATADGWVLAATDAGAAAAPDPSQAYSPGSPPSGMATGADASLGFAFSEAQATDAWTGGASYSAADEATAAELLYDEVAWGAAVPVASGGVLAAYDALDGWYVQSLGTTGSPVIDMNTTSVGPIPTAGAIYQIRLTFPGTGTAASGDEVTLAVNGGYVTGGGTSAVVTTNADGYASAEIYADSSSSSVSVSATATVGTPALDFYDSTAGGSPVVSFAPPVAASNSDVVAASPGIGGTGTISVDEGGDDTAYVGLAGGVYQVIDSQGTVVATLTTASDGAAGPTQGLPLGTYTVHEETAPAGYTPSANQSVSVVDGGNVTAHFTGAAENHAIPATLTISDADQQTGVALAGATFEVRDSPTNIGTFVNMATCTTSMTGACQVPANDGVGLLPGEYQVLEVAASNGYYLNRPPPTQTIDLAPAGAGVLSFKDRVLGSLSLSKTGDDSAYYSVAGAAFTVAGPLPSGGTAGVLTVGPSGTSNVVSGLQPGAYTVTETAPPPGYRPAAPFSVTVALGHAVTQVSVEDAADPGTLDIYDQVSGSAAPVVGGVFDVRYDALDDGTYSVDLGQCTTDDIGACSPAASSGLGLLPGRYEVTEVSAPPGYGLDTADPTRQTVLAPGAVDILDVDDPRLVPLSFVKVPTGNFDPASADLAGARFEVRDAAASGPVLASCTTDGSGECTTGAVLLPGTRYCWTEVVAPAGFEAGETGCVVASATTPETPVLVDEPGDDVEVRAVKVAAGNPADLLAGALLDLYRMGAGPAGPTVPSGTPTLARGTWVASATSTASGPVAFPLQLPGYAYCVLEATPPAGYLPASSPTCTPVLVGSPVVPATGATVTIADQPVAPAVVVTPIPTGTPPPVVSSGPAPVPAPDAPPPPIPAPAPAPAPLPLPSGVPPSPYAPAPGVVPPVVAVAPARVTIRAHKYDALEPGQPIPGVLYDLYVVGTSAPFAPATLPTGPVPALLPGRTWVSRARTNLDGDLAFDVPTGYAWCLKEVAAPQDYVLDPRAHCTSVLTSKSPLGASLVMLPEQPLMVDVQAHKYNSLQPGTSIAGAIYDVYSEAERAPGAELGADASGPVPAHVEGAFFYRREVTGRDGLLVVAVPAGYAWCLKELRPPPAYRFDTGLHCTTTLSAASPVEAVRLALPELPRHLPPAAPPAPQLPFTGIDIGPLLGAGGGLASAGLLLCVGTRTRRQGTRRLGMTSRDARRGGTRHCAGRRSRREPCGASRPGGCRPARPPPPVSPLASCPTWSSRLPVWGRPAKIALSPSIRMPFASR